MLYTSILLDMYFFLSVPNMYLMKSIKEKKKKLEKNLNSDY
jgi:hypothetical protein